LQPIASPAAARTAIVALTCLGFSVSVLAGVVFGCVAAFVAFVRGRFVVVCFVLMARSRPMDILARRHSAVDSHTRVGAFPRSTPSGSEFRSFLPACAAIDSMEGLID